MFVPNISREGRIVSGAGRGAVCGFYERMGREVIGGGEGSHEPPSKKRGSEGKSSGDFPGVGGPREKKRGSKHESLNFFFFPLGSHWPEPPSRLPKWGALDVSARTDHSLLQPKPPWQAGPIAEMARKWQERCLLQVRGVGLARAGGDDACQTPRRRPLGTQGLSQGGDFSFFFFLFILTLAI